MDYDTQWQIIYTALVENGMSPVDATIATDRVVANRPSEVLDVETSETETTESVAGNAEAEEGDIQGPPTPEHGETESDSLSPTEEM